MQRATTLHFAQDHEIKDTGGYYTGTDVEVALSEIGYKLIEDISVSGTGSVASFDFQNIPATYKILKLFVVVRSNRTGFTSDRINLKLNNDTGSNYITRVQWSGGSEEQNTAGGVFHCSYISTDSSTAGWFSNFEMTFPHYTQTNTYKTWQSRGMQPLASGTTLYIYDAMGVYQSNSAISRITLLPNSGTAFVAYSRAMLFGLK